MRNKGRHITAIIAVLMLAACGKAQEPESAPAADLQAAAAGLAENIFANRGARIDTAAVSLADSLGNVREWGSFAADSTVYFYFTPLECWDCIRTAAAQSAESCAAPHIIYVVPGQLRNAVNVIAAESGVPRERMYFLSGELGLPAESANRIFFFTMGEGAAVENVLVPDRAFDGVVDAYAGVLLGSQP